MIVTVDFPQGKWPLWMLSSLSALLDVLKDKLRPNWELDSKGLVHRDEPWAVGRWDK